MVVFLGYGKTANKIIGCWPARGEMGDSFLTGFYPFHLPEKGGGSRLQGTTKNIKLYVSAVPISLGVINKIT
ncbi:hypothetical protein CE143_08045 [Photorhabdus luminescens]|uniref:Uncharacterized protein n=1 Tax=Photorhabdus akhurstii TaxID=171438 RepID=A0ABX8LS27_9GAMM|nr:hypothetical protein B0X70_08125 [Photorhabdus akhurstii]UJD74893.1 hypothetical protein CE143_08045 [Photorhabdus luminescens]